MKRLNNEGFTHLLITSTSGYDFHKNLVHVRVINENNIEDIHEYYFQSVIAENKQANSMSFIIPIKPGSYVIQLTPELNADVLTDPVFELTDL